MPSAPKSPAQAGLSHSIKYPAVQLFVERAQAVKPDFALSSENAETIIEICHHLDGLPLAIELAAARARLLAPQRILAQLDHRLRFLVGGARDLPARQQTLRSTMDWSYDLLTAQRQTLFRRLAVLRAVGRWTIAPSATWAATGRAERLQVLVTEPGQTG
jgi:predicted ATPase